MSAVKITKTTEAEAPRGGSEQRPAFGKRAIAATPNSESSDGDRDDRRKEDRRKNVELSCDDGTRPDRRKKHTVRVTAGSSSQDDSPCVRRASPDSQANRWFG